MAIARAGLQQIRCPLHIHVTSAAVTAVSSGASAIGIAASRTSTVRAAGTTAGTVVSGTAVVIALRRCRGCRWCWSCRRFGGSGFCGRRFCRRLRCSCGFLNSSGILVTASCSGGIASDNVLPDISVCCIASGSSRCVSGCCRVMVLFVCRKRILFCNLFHIPCADPVFSVEPLDLSVKDTDLEFLSACLSCASCAVGIRCHSRRHLIGSIFRPVLQSDQLPSKSIIRHGNLRTGSLPEALLAGGIIRVEDQIRIIRSFQQFFPDFLGRLCLRLLPCHGSLRMPQKDPVLQSLSHSLR